MNLVSEIIVSNGFPTLAVLGILGLILSTWAIADAMSRPAWAFYAAGTHRMAWVIVLAVAFFLGLGVFLSAFYLISVRRKVKLQMNTRG